MTKREMEIKELFPGLAEIIIADEQECSCDPTGLRDSCACKACQDSQDSQDGGEEMPF